MKDFKGKFALLLLTLLSVLLIALQGPALALDDFRTKADTRLSKEYRVGDPDLGNTLQSSVAYLGSMVCKLRVSSPQDVNANLTIPANIELAVDPGGLVNISSGVTLTINGPFQAGPYQVFSCAGTGAVNFAIKTPGPGITINPRWWGAAGNNRADDTAAMQAAFKAWNNTAAGVIEGNPGDVYLVGPLTVIGAGHIYSYGENLSFDGRGCYLVQKDGTGNVLTDTDGLRSYSNMSIVTPSTLSNNPTNNTGIGITLNEAYVNLDKVQIIGFDKCIYGYPTLHGNFTNLRLWDCNYGIYLDKPPGHSSPNFNCFKNIYVGNFNTAGIYVANSSSNHFDHIDFENYTGQLIQLSNVKDTEFCNSYVEGSPGVGVTSAVTLDLSRIVRIIGGHWGFGRPNASLTSVFNLTNASRLEVSGIDIYCGGSTCYLYGGDTTDNYILFKNVYIENLYITDSYIPFAKFVDCLFTGGQAIVTRPQDCRPET